jgi:hypothetical protein
LWEDGFCCHAVKPVETRELPSLRWRPDGGTSVAMKVVDRPSVGVPPRKQTMRILTVIGILLICLGILALVFQGFTFFTQERVVDAGPFKVDWQKPHTVVLHPVVGIVALAAGVVLLIAGRRPTAG